MAKITIDDDEYQTDDYNDHQKKIYEEILFARSEMQRLEYTFNVLSERTKMLAVSLTNASEQVEEEVSDG